MKHKLYRILYFLLCFSIFTPSVFAIDIFVEETKLSMDVPPQIINGRTMVQIGIIGKSLNADVQWNGENRTVTLKRDENIISLEIGNFFADVNNEKVFLDVPPLILNNRTLVPISFIAKAFGENVEWNEVTRNVYIGRSSPRASAKYLVTRVIDGDTIEINYKGKKEKVRLIGIDTPESVHPDATKNVEFGLIASEFTRKNLENKKVTLEFDVSERDKYRRLLAYVWIDGIMFNKTLVESGMAQVYTYPPDVKYSEEFVELQEKARKNKVGLWAENAFYPPAINTLFETNPEKNGKLIIGNKNSMIYHPPSGRDYDKVAPHNILWFKTEEEAQLAGYRRAKQ